MIDSGPFPQAEPLPARSGAGFYCQPVDIAACMYHTGMDPLAERPVYVAQQLRDRRMQRALLQFFKPENYSKCAGLLSKEGVRI